MGRKKRGFPIRIPPKPAGPAPAPRDSGYSRYIVAAWWRYDGYGGADEFGTEAEALAHRQTMLGLGYENVHVWKEVFQKTYLAH